MIQIKRVSKSITDLGINDIDKIHFEYLFKGINKIDTGYLKSCSENESLSNVSEATFQSCLFCYWKIILDSNKNKDYVISVCQYKYLHDFKIGKTERAAPDLVLHRSGDQERTYQFFNEGKRPQMFACEIKMIQRIRQDSKNLLRDICKLKYFVFDADEYIRFEYGIFILGLGYIQDIIDIFKKRSYILLNNKKRFSVRSLHGLINAQEANKHKILCIALPPEGIVECMWLEDIIVEALKKVSIR